MALSTDLKTKAYDHIRRQLVLGQLPEGVMFSANQLARRIGMSRTPVRDAISRLESEGLLESVSKQGVRPRTTTLDEFRSKFEFRILLESGAAELAADRITPAELAVLRGNVLGHAKILRQIRDVVAAPARDIDAYFELEEQAYASDFEFHSTVIQASRNPDLAKVISDLQILTSVLGSRVHFPNIESVRQHAHDVRFHWQVYRYLRSGNASCVATLMRRHLTNAMNYHLTMRRSQRSRTVNAAICDALAGESRPRSTDMQMQKDGGQGRGPVLQGPPYEEMQRRGNAATRGNDDTAPR